MICGCIKSQVELTGYYDAELTDKFTVSGGTTISYLWCWQPCCCCNCCYNRCGWCYYPFLSNDKIKDENVKINPEFFNYYNDFK